MSNARQDFPAFTSPETGTNPSAAAMSRQDTSTRYGLRVLQALRQIIRAVDLHSRQLLRQHKITGPQLVSLLIIAKYEPVTANVIAGHVHLSPSTVIGILDRLESKGLIRRDRDLKDRRLIQVTVTEAGRVLVSNGPSPLQDTLAEAMAKLPETELVVITQPLERIVGLMQMQYVDAASIPETVPIEPLLGDRNT